MLVLLAVTLAGSIIIAALLSYSLSMVRHSDAPKKRAQPIRRILEAIAD